MEYEYEWMADVAIEELKEFIDTEQHFVKKRHNLKHRLAGMEYVFLHLDERMPSEMKHLHKINQNIASELAKIRNLIEDERLKNFEIIEEEELLLRKMKRDLGHREWRAVKKDMELEKEEEEEVIRLEIHELKQFNHAFLDLRVMMERKKMINAISEDLGVDKQKEDYEKKEEYYFIQVFKFLKAYENIFEQLWRKERILCQQIKNLGQFKV